MNWKETGTCEMFLKTPQSFGTVPGCFYFSSGELSDITDSVVISLLYSIM